MTVDLPDAGRADQREVVDTVEVDVDGLAEDAEPFGVQGDRPHQTCASAMASSYNRSNSRTTRGSSTPSLVRYSANSSCGDATAARPCHRKSGAAGRASTLDAHVDRAWEQRAHVVGEAGAGRLAHDDAQPRVADAVAPAARSSSTCPRTRAQRPRASSARASSTRAGTPGLGVDDEHVLRVLLLAEVDLDRRARVPGRRGRGHALRAVEVPERDVVRAAAGSASAFDAVVEDRLRVALAAAERAAPHEAVRGDEVDRVGAGTPRSGRRSAAASARRTARRPAAASSSSICSAPDRVPLRARTAAGRCARARRPRSVSSTTPPQLGPGRVAEQRDAGRGEHRATSASSAYWLSWLPPIDDDLRAGVAQGEQRVPHDPLRVGRRRGRLEQVAGDEHEVDGCSAAAIVGDLGEHRAVLVEAGRAPQRLADVPVGGVEDLHRGQPSPGSPA